jgi:hypothetical protein
VDIIPGTVSVGFEGTSNAIIINTKYLSVVHCRRIGHQIYQLRQMSYEAFPKMTIIKDDHIKPTIVLSTHKRDVSRSL